MERSKSGTGTALLFFLVSMLFAAGALAVHEEGHPAEVAEEFDYAAGDYAQIDWDSFTDWSLIPLHRIPDVPADALAYGELTHFQRLQMNVEQISANLENIENLAEDVNRRRAQEAVRQKFGVSVADFGKGARIRNDVLRATFGEQGMLELSRKAGWKIDINDAGRILVVDTESISAGQITTS